MKNKIFKVHKIKIDYSANEIITFFNFGTSLKIRKITNARKKLISNCNNYYYSEYSNSGYILRKN